MSGTRPITYSLDFGIRGQGRKETPAKPGETEVDTIPRIARLLALAIRLEGLIRARAIQDYAAVARLGWVTRARMTQIMKLLDLGPYIQEQILFLRSAQGLNERNLRPICNQIDWDKQRQPFQEITSGSSRGSTSETAGPLRRINLE